MHETYKPCIDFLHCMIRHLLLRKFACKFRLCNVPKPNNACHNRIEARCTVHCEIGGTQGQVGYVTDWSSWSLRGSSTHIRISECHIMSQYLPICYLQWQGWVFSGMSLNLLILWWTLTDIRAAGLIGILRHVYEPIRLRMGCPRVKILLTHPRLSFSHRHRQL